MSLPRKLRAAIGMSAGFALVAGLLLLFSLALPLEAWRTGELAAPPLALASGETFTPPATRIWIDTDAACGRSPRTDPDDCLAIFLLGRANDVDLVGISTVYGNAPLSETDQTTRALVAQLQANGAATIPVYRGSSEPIDLEKPSVPAGPQMLRAALQDEPLTIVALGPATNIASALQSRPDLQSRVTQVVAVMGRRYGHLFHPVEGGIAGSFLGHGPIFRDFNFAQDQRAVEVLLQMGLPVTLVPYEVSREVMITGEILDEMTLLGGAAAWVAQRSREWLSYWRKDIGLPGFYPFDLTAAAFVLDPSLLRCADVSVAIDNDAGLLGLLGARGLFVTSGKPAEAPIAAGHARYCPETKRQIHEWLVSRLTSAYD